MARSYRVFRNAKRIASFTTPDTAFWFASVYSKRVSLGVMLEVVAHDGLIGQFINGNPTPEFSHLNHGD